MEELLHDPFWGAFLISFTISFVITFVVVSLIGIAFRIINRN